MIKSNGTRIEPWGTPVVTGNAPDFTPFISTYIVFCLISNFHRDVELYHLCHNVLIFEVELCDQEYLMLSRDLKIY